MTGTHILWMIGAAMGSVKRDTTRREPRRLPTTQEEIDAVWADARRVVREEQELRRRLYLGLPAVARCKHCRREFGTNDLRCYFHSMFCRQKKGW